MSQNNILRLAVQALLAISASFLVGPIAATEVPKSDTLRVATFNLQDVRTEQLSDGNDARLKQLARMIQQVRPDVVLLNEITYDSDGRNGRYFADRYLAVPQAADLTGLVFQSFMAPSNTGAPSGLDLNGDGVIASQPGTEQYAADCWGYGRTPGQYGMALLVRRPLVIDAPRVRTFQCLRWSTMPGALAPSDPETGQPWYSDDVWPQLRLSSKSHWDVPIRRPDGRVLHALCSHPTPPVFDGPEDRNGCRNHDEIRLWAEYLNDSPWVEDDQGRRGGLSAEEPFVVLGDLNADLDEGDSRADPVRRFLLDHPRVSRAPAPTSPLEFSTGRRPLDPDDTAQWGLRIDYVLPSRELAVTGSGIVRYPRGDSDPPSDHFLVWVDVSFPK